MLSANSLLLSHQEVTSTSNVCIKVGLTVKGNNGRFHRTRRLQYSPSVAVLKVFSTTTKPKRLHLLRPLHKGKGDSSPNLANTPPVSN